MKTKNLTIQEAIQSGKPIRRMGSTDYFVSVESKDRRFTVADILATDWEIKVEPKVIWVNVYDDGSMFGHGSATEAHECKTQGAECVTRKFVEVIE